MINLIEMNSICKSYRNIGFETKVLKDVTLHIKEGDYVSIIGPSGAGKSTLMAIMGRMASYTGKSVSWEQALNSKEDLTPDSYKFGSKEVTPVAIPGKTKFY